MNIPSIWVFCYMLPIFHLIRISLFVCVYSVPMSYILDINGVKMSVCSVRAS